MKDLSALENTIEYRFKNRSLLQEALTHPSYANEHPGLGIKDNQRLEFLGDSVLGTCVATMLFEKTDLPEGRMTKIRSLVVRSESLAQVADSISLLDYMRFGQGEAKTGGKYKRSNAEDSMEALIGAIYLDSDFATAKAFVETQLGDLLDRALAGKLIYDYKSKVYEWVQSFDKHPDLRFEVVLEEGPAHDREFTVELLYKGKTCTEAKGKSIRQAEQEASRLFLEEWAKTCD